MRKRILSMLLVLVMVLGMLPAQVFATDTPTEPCITEGCTFGASHEGNCSNYVAPNGSCTTEGCYFDAGHQGNCSNYVAPSEPCETEGCTYGANHEGNCSNYVEPTADELAAQAVVDLIDAIGSVTLESETAISAADTAYNALTDAQKVFVSNLDVLTAAEADYEDAIKDPSSPDTGDRVPVILLVCVALVSAMAIAAIPEMRKKA